MRLQPLILTTLIGLSFAIVACDVQAPAIDDSGSASLGIKGGYADYQDTAVLGLVSFSNQGMGACTGTLISPNVVLTARHCIAPTLGTPGGGVACGQTYFGNAYSPDGLYVSAQAQLSQNPNDYKGVWEVVTPPNGNDFCGNDMALLILGQPIPAAVAIPMIPRVDSQLDPGDEYSAIGYGAVNDGGQGSGMRRRRDNLFVECVAPGCGGHWLEDTEWVGDTGVCQGDSGGPAVDTDFRVVGVASRGASGCQYPIYGSVFGWGDWIKDTTIYASEKAGIAPPAWATGWPTDPQFSYPVGSSCGANEQCKSGVCHDGYCTRQCNEAAPCPSPYSCDPISGFCLLPDVGEACGENKECNSGICLHGFCTRECDNDKAKCPAGYVCNIETWLCDLPPIGGPCEFADDCATGHCLEGGCTRKCDDTYACPEDYYCNESALCSPVPMGDACESAADCMSGLCEQGFCTRECEEMGDCIDGFICDETAGACLPVPVGHECLANIDCDGGICEEGICTRICDEAFGCPDGFTCGDTGMCEVEKKKRDSGLYPGCASGSAPVSTGLLILLSMSFVALVARRRRFYL